MEMLLLGLLLLVLIILPTRSSKPATLAEARPGTMLTHSEHGVTVEECEETDVYDIEEAAADRLCSASFVEVKTVDGQMYRYTPQSIKHLGW